MERSRCHQSKFLRKASGTVARLAMRNRKSTAAYQKEIGLVTVTSGGQV